MISMQLQTKQLPKKLNRNSLNQSPTLYRHTNREHVFTIGSGVVEWEKFWVVIKTLLASAFLPLNWECVAQSVLGKVI